jgi:hypothetical protein
VSQHAPDLNVSGDDTTLAGWVADHPGALIAFDPAPESDVARAVGLPPGGPVGRTVVTLDALRLGDGDVAVNMVVIGTPPDRTGRFTRSLPVTLHVDGTDVPTARTTTIVIATGQYLRGLDVVPRGHPGDGRLECQVYRLRPAERHQMRARLPQGTHLPHPRIAQRVGRTVEVQADAPVAIEVDGEPRPPVRSVTVEIVPAAYRLLV